MRRQAILSFLLLLIFQVPLHFSLCTHLKLIPGSSLELPCFSFQSDFPGADITWNFNGRDIAPSVESSGFASVKKNGRFLSLPTVTPANEGIYVCLVKENNMEMIKTYNITVDASFGYDYNIRVPEGSDAHLPCHFSTSSQVETNALWFKETGVGRRAKLNTEDDSTDNNKKTELLYPLDHDQTMILRNTVLEDGGIYHCESAEGKKLSTVYIIVEATPTSPSHTCEGFTSAWEPCLDENSRTGEPMLQESMADFSMKLYAYLRELHPTSNLLFSPVSISGLLSHLLLGARGDTRRAIQTAVCVPHEFHCVHFQMKKLREKMAGSLQMASQIYYNPQINLSESFTNQTIQFYEAEPMKLLETSEDNTQMINSWVANVTKNKITHLVDSMPTSTQLVLLNAVSFSGQWKVKFNQKPKKGLFTKLNGDLVLVPLLYHEKYMVALTYDEELKAQVAKFALTGDSSLYILLPRSNKVTDLQAVEEKMTDTAVRQMIEQMKATSPQQVEVTLPQIKLDVQPDMNILIKKLGLSSLFEGANLCGLSSEERIVLDDAKHKAFLALTEQGVEAGAATSMSFSRSLHSFSALRPFIMLLWSDQANVPLFIGRVTDP